MHAAFVSPPLISAALIVPVKVIAEYVVSELEVVLEMDLSPFSFRKFQHCVLPATFSGHRSARVLVPSAFA